MTDSAITLAHGVLSLAASILLLSTLPQHVRVRNIGTLAMIAWGAIGNLCGAISDFLFFKTIDSMSPTLMGWCDFATVIQYVFPFGFSIGMLLVLRRLEVIASTRHALAEKNQRRTQYLEIAVVVGVPLILIPLHYTVQGTRFIVIENFGCGPPLFPAIASIFVYAMWQPLLNTVNLIYALLVLRWFLLRRRQFSAILQSSGAGISKRRYIRLMALVLTEVAWAWPVAIFIFVVNIKADVPYLPYVSWDHVHQGFDQIEFVSLDGLNRLQRGTIELGRWSAPFFAFNFWLFFGLSAESIKDQKNIARKGWQVAKSALRGRQSSAKIDYVASEMTSQVLERPEKDANQSSDTIAINELPFTKRGEGFHTVTIETDKFVV